MLDFLSPYKLLIEIAVITSIIGGAAIGVHAFLNHEQQIGYDRAVAEYTVKLAEANAAARKTEQDMTKQLEAAQNANAQRQQAINAATAAANTSATSLRDAINHIRDGVPSSSFAALAQSVASLGAVLNECSSRYGEVASKADRHSADSQLLLDSWPKVK